MPGTSTLDFTNSPNPPTDPAQSTSPTFDSSAVSDVGSSAARQPEPPLHESHHQQNPYPVIPEPLQHPPNPLQHPSTGPTPQPQTATPFQRQPQPVDQHAPPRPQRIDLSMFQRPSLRLSGYDEPPLKTINPVWLSLYPQAQTTKPPVQHPPMPQHLPTPQHSPIPMSLLTPLPESSAPWSPPDDSPPSTPGSHHMPTTPPIVKRELLKHIDQQIKLAARAYVWELLTASMNNLDL